MNKKAMTVLLLALGLGSLGGVASAEPNGANLNFCTKLSGSISSGTAAPGQMKVIYGPYTVKCDATFHRFTVRGASGQLTVKVEKRVGDSWNAITPPTYDPSGSYGAGTFRLVLDNLTNHTVSYRGSFSVPM
ncbi:hypothetical protein [Pseudomonas sp. LP_7_YM]|uniref:hypothetical protein n=1 Tax=Pseudomonas sp. LP_7_YM TaxID=2485137 RepID=UPI00105E954C|nr:hypothetical protein [Pseudomonas sp. LP_7_YM]TDV69814.1 hypothetical protein EC915_10272 [Pseudomonas sp. LP_7_YM]